jgi:hypothetical protein
MSALDELDLDALEYLEGLDDEIIACLGDHHPWPKLSLGDGVDAEPQRDGAWQLKVTCPDCGRERWKIMLRNGQWGTPRWEYSSGPKPKPGLGLTKAHYSAEHARRLSKRLRKQPRRRPRKEKSPGRARAPLASGGEAPGGHSPFFTAGLQPSMTDR